MPSDVSPKKNREQVQVAKKEERFGIFGYKKDQLNPTTNNSYG